MMHICFLSMDYPSVVSGGGVGKQVRTLGRALVNAGHKVAVVALAGTDLPSFTEDEGIKVWRVKPGSLHWYAYRTPLAGRFATLPLRELENAVKFHLRIRDLHKKEPFDLIEGTETGTLGVALWLEGVPLVTRLHGEEYTFRKYTPDLTVTTGLRLCRFLQRAALRRSQALVSVSHAHAKEIANELGANCPPITVVPNCIDRMVSTPSGEGLRDTATVLFVGRLERCKGIPLLLEAAKRVALEVPHVQFILAGAPHPTLARSEIDALVHKHELEGRVNILGHIPADQLSSLYKRATICVLPSYYETFGIAALEPMAYGVPIVASRTGGLPEVVEDGSTGILVPHGESKALASAILRLLRDPQLRVYMGANGIQRATREFNVEKHLSATLDLYDRVLRPAGTGRGEVHSSSSRV